MPSKSKKSEHNTVKQIVVTRVGDRLPGIRDAQIIRSFPNMIKENSYRAKKIN